MKAKCDELVVGLEATIDFIEARIQKDLSEPVTVGMTPEYIDQVRESVSKRRNDIVTLYEAIRIVRRESQFALRADK